MVGVIGTPGGHPDHLSHQGGQLLQHLLVFPQALGAFEDRDDDGNVLKLLKEVELNLAG